MAFAVHQHCTLPSPITCNLSRPQSLDLKCLTQARCMQIFDQIYVGVMAMMIGYFALFGIKKFAIGATLMIPLLIITVIFRASVDSTFKRPMENLSIHAAADLDRADRVCLSPPMPTHLIPSCPTLSFSCTVTRGCGSWGISLHSHEATQKVRVRLREHLHSDLRHSVMRSTSGQPRWQTHAPGGQSL